MPCRKRLAGWSCVGLGLVLLCGAPAAASFVNFESGHVRPLALAPDGSRLFAVNTPDNRLAIYDVTPGGLALAAEVAVGLEPVAVAVRTNAGTGRTEAWVVNHLSDSVSIVEVDPADPGLSRVVRTLLVGDEPRDVVFAGSAGDRAFVTTARRGQNLPTGVLPRLTEAGVGRALVWAFDAESLGGTPLSVTELFGDTPRALAASPDGTRVYAAIFHSGNQTATVIRQVVDTVGLPPPPSGATPNAPVTGLIVKFNGAAGQWRDELGRSFNAAIPFRLPDQDVFVLDADANPPALAASPAPIAGVGTILFNMAVNPATGAVVVSNTDARNHVRFEPLIAATHGVQGHIAESRLTVIDGATATPVHLNPHIDYAVPTGSPAEIAASLAFPTDLVFSSDGATLYVAALGSGAVGVLDAAALEAGSVSADRVDVGGGPSGLALDETRDRLYVMDRIGHALVMVSNASDPLTRAVTATIPLRFDPSPAPARAGRRFLYDARGTSGHGDAACASCHVFGDLDSLAWDLGDPFGAVVANPNPFRVGPLPNPIFHPMKGPMTTQSLRGMDEAGPMHWRGDRTAPVPPGFPLNEDGAFKEFNPAFVGLLGRAAELTDDEMQAFTDFILSVQYPPNPIRPLDDQGTVAEDSGEVLFNTFPSDIAGTRPCEFCHRLPFGTDGLSSLEGEPQEFKIPHMRNMYQKVGMFGLAGDPFRGDQVRGFGYLHDGAVDTLFRFVSAPAFALPDDVARRDLEAFLLAFDTGLAPAVGQQVSATPVTFADAGVVARRDLLLGRADAGDCDLIVKHVRGGEARGALYVGGGQFQPDRAAEPPIAAAALLALAAAPGAEQVYTCVPPGSGTRLGVDRDDDGVFDRDELDAGTDPAAPWSIVPTCPGGSIDQLAQAQVKVARTLAPAGDEKLTIKGEWVLASATPPLDPLANGFNLRLLAPGGATIFQRSVPSGAAATSRDPGWKVNKNGTKWTFKDKDGVLAGGITKIVVSDRSSRQPGLVKVSIKGKNGDFQVEPAEVPVTVILVAGGGQQIAADQCATRAFNPASGAQPRCAFNGSGTTLRCK